jgi:phosphoserine phosphatase
METMNLEQAKSLIPADLRERMVTDGNKTKIAVFDLDNTLLEGDIGDAVLVRLKQMEKTGRVTIDDKIIPLTWEQYIDLIKTKGKWTAYKRVVTSQAGIPLERFIEITREVMAMEEDYLELDDVKVPVPRPNELMKALVFYLKSLDYKVYVISASNHYSVQYTAETFFDIPAANIFGMKPTLRQDTQYGKVLGSEIDGPVTVGEGKAETYRKYVGMVPPLLTAGDSTTDFEVLNLVDPRGICIWVRDDEKQYESIKQKLDYPSTAYFLYRER